MKKTGTRAQGQAWHYAGRLWRCTAVLLLLKVSPMKALLLIAIFLRNDNQ
jgi:hypothetical protein